MSTPSARRARRAFRQHHVPERLRELEQRGLGRHALGSALSPGKGGECGRAGIVVGVERFDQGAVQAALFGKLAQQGLDLLDRFFVLALLEQSFDGLELSGRRPGLGSGRFLGRLLGHDGR